MGNKRRTPRQARSKATLSAILDAVGRILRADGPDAVTTNRVARVAGVSVGTLYQYFASKQDIYEALHEREFQKLAGNVGRAFVTSPAQDLDALLVSVVDAIIETRMSDPALHRLLVRTVPRSTDADANRIAGAFRMAIAAHREELRDDLDLDLFAHTLGNVLGGVVNGAVLRRSTAIRLEDARSEGLRAIRAYVSVHRR